MVVVVSRLAAWGLASLGLAAASGFSMCPWALGELSYHGPNGVKFYEFRQNAGLQAVTET